MSQKSTNLPQDIEGSSLHGDGSMGMASFGSKPVVEIVSDGSKPPSPAINLPHQDLQGVNDGTCSFSLDEANPTAIGFPGPSSSNSIPGSDSVKLATEDINSGLKPTSPPINPPQNGTTSLDEAMLIDAGLVSKPNSSSRSDSIKRAGDEDINNGAKLASLLMDHVDENNSRSNPTSPTLGYTNKNNKGGSKSASLGQSMEVKDGKSNKGEEKGILVGGEGGGDDNVGSNSKSTKISIEGDIGDDIKNAPKPMNVAGGSSNNGKGKDKGATMEMDRAMHIWTERERRKKMKNFYSTLHSLLPQLPHKADKATIVGEAVDYIKTLEGTVHMLEKLKMERMHTQQFGASSSIVASAPPSMCHGTPTPQPRETNLANMVNNWSVQHAVEAGSTASPPALLQTWSAPNITLSVGGNEAFIGVRTSRQPCVLTKVLSVLEKHCIDIVTMSISSHQNQSMFNIHARINAASTTTMEDKYKLAASEMLQWIAK
ncbi:hypothetical protein PR202_gb15555 [Eleusine coracana subsp. coracana]|uniref:BHLH domain-containing protein n=1 Tax=Eleusine coracana subsp. coracana TaxID=191504 RepID=A0AAV5EZE7_ELECO|nr:hypothetical protein PR202_gb15555 [Eleusine coracana subsp. coracana]